MKPFSTMAVLATMTATMAIMTTATAPASAQTTQVSLSPAATAPVPPGGAAQITANLTGSGSPAKVAALQFSVSLPVEAQSVAGAPGLSAAAAQKSVTCSPVQSQGPTGKAVSCVVAGPNQTTISDGPVAVLAITIAPTATAGASLQVALRTAATTLKAASATASAIPVTVGVPASSGIPVTAAPSPCDVTADGKVDLLDLQAVITQILSTCGTADVNKDGACDVLDAQIVANAIVPGGSCTVAPATPATSPATPATQPGNGLIASPAPATLPATSPATSPATPKPVLAAPAAPKKK